MVNDPQSYVDLALRLANEKPFRELIIERIQARSEVLFDDMEAVFELERFFIWAHNLKEAREMSGRENLS